MPVPRYASALPALLLLLSLNACREADAGQARVTIHTAAGHGVSYRVEVALTDLQRSRGLMYRRQMAADAGMLFLYQPPAPVAMWMHNTLLPLDMLFVDEHGVIVKIAANTVPRSTRHINSGAPVAAVLELNAGQAVRRGIQVGDRMEWRKDRIPRLRSE